MSKKKNTHTRTGIRKKKVRNRVLIILIPLLIVFLGASGYLLHLYNKAETAATKSFEEDSRPKSDYRKEEVDPKFDNVSVLIMGVDENDHRQNEGNSRTDTLILATLNKDEKSVKLHSIPRDSYVFIPKVGYEDKINHAHAFGEHEATIDAVENLLEIPIDYWVKLNFNAFVQVIDAIDGINIEVPYEFYESDSMDKRDAIHLLPGEQILDGEEALALARTRKLDNDIERGKRQLEIIKSVLSKTASVSSIFKLDNVIDAVGDNMTTNMRFSEMKSFISYGTNGKNIDLETYSLEGTNYQPESIYYWLLDEVALAETKALLQDHLEIESKIENDQDSERAKSSETTTDSY